MAAGSSQRAGRHPAAAAAAHRGRSRPCSPVQRLREWRLSRRLRDADAGSHPPRLHTRNGARSGACASAAPAARLPVLPPACAVRLPCIFHRSHLAHSPLTPPSLLTPSPASASLPEPRTSTWQSSACAAPPPSRRRTPPTAQVRGRVVHLISLDQLHVEATGSASRGLVGLLVCGVDLAHGRLGGWVADWARPGCWLLTCVVPSGVCEQVCGWL